MNKITFSSLLILVFGTLSTTAQQTLILTNHLGYEPNTSKHAVIECNNQDLVSAFRVIDVATGLEVIKGTPVKSGPVNKWKNWCFWTINLDNLNTEGSYVIEADVNKALVRSFPFKIRKNILEYETLSDVIYYFKEERCSGLLDKADRTMKYIEKPGTIDIHGGWFDATGDYGKHLSHLSFSTYFNPQQIPFTVWGLLKSYQLLDQKNDVNFNQYKRRLLDEAIYGADYLVRSKDPNGSFYRSIDGRGPTKKPEDRIIGKEDQGILFTKMDSLERIKDPFLNALYHSAPFESGYREGAGFAIAALAFASTMKTNGDFDTKDYLLSAESAFDHLEKNNAYYLNDGIENIVDNYCSLIAAVELFKASGNNRFKISADTKATELMQRLASDKNYTNYWRADGKDRPFFHAADAGMPVLCLLMYMDIADETQKNKVKVVIKKSLQFELAITNEVNNPFGYSRQYVQELGGARKSTFFFPHKTETDYWWQGENARLGSMATAARMASVYFKDDIEFSNKLQTFASNQINWILGENPFDCCMLQGSGRNNPPYMFKYSIEYTNAPGGICNGITAGYNEPEDIDFNIPYRITQKDDDWRWTEQWLPHVTWYMLAVASK